MRSDQSCRAPYRLGWRLQAYCQLPIRPKAVTSCTSRNASYVYRVRLGGRCCGRRHENPLPKRVGQYTLTSEKRHVVNRVSLGGRCRGRRYENHLPRAAGQYILTSEKSRSVGWLRDMFLPVTPLKNEHSCQVEHRP